MPEVLFFSEKVIRVCDLNHANSRNAPKNRTELSDWLGIGSGTLSKRYKGPSADIHVSLERAIVMALGFGPSDTDFDAGSDKAWSRWTTEWSQLWRSGNTQDFIKKFEDSGYFFPRLRGDSRLNEMATKIRKPRKAGEDQNQLHLLPATSTILVARTSDNHLDKLASLQVIGVSDNSSTTLVATCTFGTVEVNTEDAAYLVSINRCHAELVLQACSLTELLVDKVVDGRSGPAHQMAIKNEPSRSNHPSWRLEHAKRRTPLGGEYDEIFLGNVQGAIDPGDEASIVVIKAGFKVAAVGGPDLELGGALNSLLRYLVVEHVGEIQQRGSYRYHLSAGPIRLKGEDD
ncbi:MAG: hypothetical protein Q8L13_06410 [Bradyrhizobium sp.]|uniref:hypothetical protein n=1 Tax=Bradyrhizobium sp. TaxID=376 RepID=UPI002731F3B5|nr:hypothetical protein [Bradyrhizobium sp.]MDP1865963.1 hypothetical protein [Bradyrhizobium sp.]